MANTDPIVLKQKELAGINTYYNLGYKGKGNVMQLEDPNTEHGTGVCEDILDIAPGMKIFRTGSSIRCDNTTLFEATCKWDGVTYEIEDFIKKFNIKFVTESIGGPQYSSVMEDYWDRLKKLYNIVLVAPTGNYGAGEVTTAFPIVSAIQVGAISISDHGVVRLCNYSGYEDIGDVDFVYFTGDQDGTSFSTPRIVGVLGLLYDRFGNKTQDEFFEMLKLLRVDMGPFGLDAPTGWGYPVLHYDDNRRLGKLAEQTVTGILREIDVKLLPTGEIKRVKAVLVNGENYTRLRDNEDVLHLADVEYDAVNKIPTIQD